MIAIVEYEDKMLSNDESDERLFVRDKLYILFIIKLNLIIDLFWKIGFNPLSDEHS